MWQCNWLNLMDNFGINASGATWWNLTDVTLADEDTNYILTENANRAIQGNVAMQVTQPGEQLWKQCKWRHLMTKF